MSEGSEKPYAASDLSCWGTRTIALPIVDISSSLNAFCVERGSQSFLEVSTAPCAVSRACKLIGSSPRRRWRLFFSILSGERTHLAWAGR
jgi:hypothetical protein